MTTTDLDAVMAAPTYAMRPEEMDAWVNGELTWTEIAASRPPLPPAGMQTYIPEPWGPATAPDTDSIDIDLRQEARWRQQDAMDVVELVAATDGWDDGEGR